MEGGGTQQGQLGMHPSEHDMGKPQQGYSCSLPHPRSHRSLTDSVFTQVSLMLQSPETKSPLPPATSPAGGSVSTCSSREDRALILFWMSGLSRGMRLRVHEKAGTVFLPLAQPSGLVQNT